MRWYYYNTNTPFLEFWILILVCVVECSESIGAVTTVGYHLGEDSTCIGKSVNPKDAVGYRFGLDHISVLNQLISDDFDRSTFYRANHPLSDAFDQQKLQEQTKGRFFELSRLFGGCGCQIETRLPN